MANFIPQPNCADPASQTLITVEEAREQIQMLLKPVNAWCKCSLREALDRVLHQPIVSSIQVPPQDNSAMDGYALASESLSSDSFSLRQIGTAFAGKPYLGNVQPGECVRIMTGAIMPADCDTVIMQEHTQVDGDSITFHGTHKPGQNVRLAGEDITVGTEVLPANHRLTPADLGLIASLGIGEVYVKRRLRVAFFSTGDELRSIGEALDIGQIYDSNRYTLYGMLKRLDVDIIDMGVIEDDPIALRQSLIQASEQADVVITSGGVSVGEADYIKDILAEIGTVNFWKIAMKPGSPVTYGQINDALFFGLPGNPVSVMVTFYQFVQHALKLLSGESAEPPLLLEATCDSKIRKRPGRVEFQRGICSTDSNGQLHVKTTGAQGSGILHSMSLANCFILLDSDRDGVEPGQRVFIQLFSGLV